MQSIAHWLNTIGLGQYAHRFADNDIDASILRQLTDEDLEKIGVSLGHRKKMLRAIAELDELACVPEAACRIEAERRQLTVMFADLVGSTVMSTKLDPEDLREVIGAYHRCCGEQIARSGGFVARYMGDGVLAYFGYPEAHEDDVERAVRAALALVAAVAKLSDGAGAALRMRIGIATGLVVVGDLVGAAAAQEHDVVGETPNLAARLQALAENRFEALRATRTPLVGREEEIDLLMRRWQQAKGGEGCVVLISGEPGIGKSRLAQAVLERLSGEPYTPLRLFCSPHHQDSALYPAIRQLEQAAGFQREDTPEKRMDKLEAVLSQATNDFSEAAPLIADLLSVPTGDRYPPVDLTPQKRKERTLQALLAQVERLAARQPVLFVLEDAHWIDPSSREWLDLTIDRVPTLPALLIITYRPERTPPWVGHPHVTLLSLSRLPRRQRAEMIMRVTGGKALPKEIADQIIDRTDGVPLFVEELTKAVVESGVLVDAGDRYTVCGPLPSLAIPTSLHASLLARLDRLAPAREVAQIGAALGRQFSHELISAVAAMPQQKLDDALDQLVNAELVFRRGRSPDAMYTFKHALVQDAAYSVLLRGPRRQLHQRIANVLEERFPEVAGSQPELLARHCAEGGLIEQAVQYWFTAGERALRACANVEAIKHLSQGLQLLALLPDSPERQRQELRFQTGLGPPLMAVKGWAAPEAMQAYSRADELSRVLGDHSERFKIVWGLWILHIGRGESRRGRELSNELFRLAEQEDDDDLRLEAHHSAWGTLTWLGEFAACSEHTKRGLTIYRPAHHGAHAFTYGGHDPGVCGCALGAVNLWFLGYP
jgi:class 3 adenylate cyclase